MINLEVRYLNAYVVRERKTMYRVVKHIVLLNMALSLLSWQRHVKLNSSLPITLLFLIYKLSG